MTVGFVRLFPVHRGTSFVSADNRTYLLCNGSSHSRATYPVLSSVWPSGAYGSTSDNIHLPNLTDIELRCWSAGGFDPEVNSRIALSGVLPVGSGCGSFQNAGMATHAHVDDQGILIMSGGGGNPPSSTTVNKSLVTTDSITVSGTGNVGSADVTALKLPHTKVYYYICAT